MIRFRPIRFSIRSLLLLAALIAIYLGWRLQISESHVVTAVKHAGGKVLSGYNYIGILVDGSGQYHPVLNPTPEPKRTFSEFVFGDSQKRSVHIVELPIENFTPDLTEKIETLRYLKLVKAVIHQDPWSDLEQKRANAEATKLKFRDRLAELETRFGDRFSLEF